MAYRIQQRRATEAQWAAVNPILAVGEIGYVIDKGTIKIGDGLTPWINLVAFRAENTSFATNADKLDGFDTSSAANVNTIAVRDANGNLSVATPTAADHVATKAYADAAAQSIKVEVFTASGVYTLPPFATAVDVVCIGGGASGGWSGSSTSAGYGGPGGGRARALIPAAALSPTVPVIVGTGGGIITTASTNGLSGTPSSFGTFVSASGGSTSSTYVVTTAANGMRGGVPVNQAPQDQMNESTPGYPGQGGAAFNNGYKGAHSPDAGGGGGAYNSVGGYSGALVSGAVGTSTLPTGDGLSRSGSGLGGSGGAGGKSTNTATYKGGNGGIPGGGGGCSYAAYSAALTTPPGVGGRGEVIVVTYF